MPRYLVVANQTLADEPLVSRISELARADPSSFHVVVPATPPSDHVWTEGEAIATARSRLEAAMARFAGDRKSTRLNSSHWITSRMPSSA